MKRFLFFLLLPTILFAQDEALTTSINIPEKLLENANAVIRQMDVQVVIEDYDRVEVITERIVTVLNEKGDRAINAYEHYDDHSKIKSIEAVIYDKFGKRIERFRKSDFSDVSAVSDGTLYSDSRVMYLDYTARSYPYTVYFTSRVVNKNTAFLPTWFPLENYFISTQNSSFTIDNQSGVELKTKEENFEGYSIVKEGTKYSVNNLEAIRSEAYSPSFKSYAPHLKSTLKKFKMAELDGVNENWEGFGKWMHDHLISEVDEIPDELKKEIQDLVKDLPTEKERAKAVYEFMQNRSRYISVQIGIGGWRPTEASEVHERAYGDCKGLTNYTKVLLKEAGIESNYAVIYGGSEIQNIDKEFSSTQGNHVILHIPKLDEEENIWLECTSKTAPFGMIAGFTDDRDALVVTENGGKIMHTTAYDTKDNLQLTTADIKLDREGNASGKVHIKSSGYQYTFREHMAEYSDKKGVEAYQNRWDYLNGLIIKSFEVKVDKDKQLVEEEVSIEQDRAAQKMGNILLVNLNMFNRHKYDPPTYSKRVHMLNLERGYVDHDDYVIHLSENMKVDGLPEAVELESKFGNYKLEVVEEENKIIFKRSIQINKGLFQPEDYEAFEEFRKSIVKNDEANAAILIN